MNKGDEKVIESDDKGLIIRKIKSDNVRMTLWGLYAWLIMGGMGKVVADADGDDKGCEMVMMVMMASRAMACLWVLLKRFCFCVAMANC